MTTAHSAVHTVNSHVGAAFTPNFHNAGTNVSSQGQVASFPPRQATSQVAQVIPKQNFDFFHLVAVETES